MLKNKAASLCIVFFVYVLAVGVGVLVLEAGMERLSPLWNMFAATFAGTVVVFLSNLIFKNASVYDPYWSVQPPFIMMGFVFFYNIPLYTPESGLSNAVFVLATLFIWAIRLTVNWMITFDNLEWQDWRYTRFKEAYPKIFQLIVFTGIMMMPTCLVYLGCVPLYFLLTSDSAPLFPIIGGLIILLGTALEFFADRQMHRWKRQGSGPYINEGLWKYSRHPNYLGEMLIWIGVFVGSIGALSDGRDFGLSIIGPVLMVLLFLFISIPMMEKHVLEKRPEYAEYRKKVRALI
ncbi:MAG: DUF1295 domain-containing protein [Spirochaetaceae bacterium]|nr:DUF1295 domain-containing protein [Spirochaetaceae bacterium]